MPELPEVETFIRELAPELNGRRITRARVFWPGVIAFPTDEEFVTAIAGARFDRFERSIAADSAECLEHRRCRRIVRRGEERDDEGALERPASHRRRPRVQGAGEAPSPLLPPHLARQALSSCRRRRGARARRLRVGRRSRGLNRNPNEKSEEPQRKRPVRRCAQPATERVR